MTQCIELSEGDYGWAVTVSLYKSDDDVTVESLTSASKVSLDITRLDETPLVQDAVVTVTNATTGTVTFTPLSTWFTSAKLGDRSDYLAIFKIYYSSGKKHSFKIPMYIHLH